MGRGAALLCVTRQWFQSPICGLLLLEFYLIHNSESKDTHKRRPTQSRIKVISETVLGSLLNVRLSRTKLVSKENKADVGALILFAYPIYLQIHIRKKYCKKQELLGIMGEGKNKRHIYVYGQQESNPHDSESQGLNLLCLPIPLYPLLFINLYQIRTRKKSFLFSSRKDTNINVLFDIHTTTYARYLSINVISCRAKLYN